MDSTQTDLLRDATRMRLLDAATEGATVSELAGTLGVPATRLYHHIDKLVAAGLLEIVGSVKRDASVAAVYRAPENTMTREGGKDDITLALRDAERDVEDAASDAARTAGRIVTRMTREQAEELVARIETIASEIRRRDEPNDGDLVGLTYVVAPLARPRPPAISLRMATSADRVWIQRIVYEAIAWNPETSIPPIEQIVDHPEFARYHREWGRPGDVGVVCESDGEVVGGAFFRLFTDEDHGHGYVDESTPEVAVAVWGVPRGKGVGSRLLAALHAAAAESGFTQLSLSVDEDNPAANLYPRHGYVHHSSDSGSLRMVRRLS